jgi:hypothetical protein
MIQRLINFSNNAQFNFVSIKVLTFIIITDNWR